MGVARSVVGSELLGKFGERLTKRIVVWKGQIDDQAGAEFNIGSPAQLGQILYGRLALPVAGLKKGKTGVSTAADVLEKLKDLHPIIPLIMEFRELDKLKNTYVDSLPELVRKDGRIHTSFNQTIAQTGWLSSTHPNLHNIPVRSEEGGRSGSASCPDRGPPSSSPTTTRSNCAASPTSPATPA